MDDFGNEIKLVIITSYGFSEAILAHSRFIIDGGGNKGSELTDENLRFYGLIA